MKKIIFIFLLVFTAQSFWAQTVHKLLREGNKLFNNEKYGEAAESYHKALEKDPSNIKGKFNLGNATYETNDFESAVEQFSAAANVADNPQVQADAYYNLGNAFFQQAKEKKDQKLFESSVEAYKNSLRLNPKDEDAKKNLALSQRYIQRMKQQEQQQQQENQDKQEQKPKEEEQQQQEQQQQQSQQQQQQQEQQEPQEQQASEDLTKEEALELLKIMDEEEKKVQEKLRKESSNAKKPDKDW